MSSFRFLHAADVHLDSPLRGLDRYEGAPVERLRVATREAFSNLVDLALEEDVDLVVLAGDIYDDDQKDFGTALFLNAQLRRLGAVPVVILQGNHDAAAVITKSLRPPENVRVLRSDRPETLPYPELGLAVHGQSFKQRKITRDLTRDYPEPEAGVFNLGVLHTALEGAEGHETYAPCKLADLVAKGYDYWALGHIHQRSVRHEAPWIVYPGNLQGRHIREAGAKGAYLVEVRDGRVDSCDFRALDVLRWARVEVDVAGATRDEEIWERVTARLDAAAETAEDRLLAVRLELIGTTPRHGALILEAERALNEARNAAAATGREIWLERLRVRTRPLRDDRILFEREDELGDLMRRLRDGAAPEASTASAVDGGGSEEGPGEENDETPAAGDHATLLRRLDPDERRALTRGEENADAAIEAEARALLVERILRAEEHGA